MIARTDDGRVGLRRVTLTLGEEPEECVFAVDLAATLNVRTVGDALKCSLVVVMNDGPLAVRPMEGEISLFLPGGDAVVVVAREVEGGAVIEHREEVALTPGRVTRVQFDLDE